MAESHQRGDQRRKQRETHWLQHEVGRVRIERRIEEALYPSHVEAPILRVGVVPVHREGEDAQRTYERESETAFGLPAGQAGACGSES
jgi:hypothetical protein